MMPKQLSTIPCPACGLKTLIVKKEYVKNKLAELSKWEHKYIIDCTSCNMKVDDLNGPSTDVDMDPDLFLDFDPY